MSKRLKALQALDLKVLNSLVDINDCLKIERRDGIVHVYFTMNGQSYSEIGTGSNLKEALVAADGIGEEGPFESIKDNSFINASLNSGKIYVRRNKNKTISSYLEVNNNPGLCGFHSTSDNIEDSLVKIEKWLQLNNARNKMTAKKTDGTSEMLSKLDEIVKDGNEVRMVKDNDKFIASVGQIVDRNNRQCFYPKLVVSASSPVNALIKLNRYPVEDTSLVNETDQNDMIGLIMNSDDILRINFENNSIYATLESVRRDSNSSYVTSASNVAEAMIKMYKAFDNASYTFQIPVAGISIKKTNRG